MHGLNTPLYAQEHLETRDTLSWNMDEWKFNS